jgi:hypothetical protein
MLVCAALTGCGDSDPMRAPNVIETAPADGATLVPNTTPIRAVFDHAMNPAGLTAERASRSLAQIQRQSRQM